MAEETSIKEFVLNTIRDMEAGLPNDNYFIGNVRYNVTVAVQKTKGKKFSVKIVDADTRKSEVTTQQISISIGSKKATEEAIRAMRGFFQEIINSAKELEKSKKRK